MISVVNFGVGHCLFTLYFIVDIQCVLGQEWERKEDRKRLAKGRKGRAVTGLGMNEREDDGRHEGRQRDTEVS